MKFTLKPHSKLSPKVGRGVIIFNNLGQILLGKRIGSHGSNSWGAPGGHLEFGEEFKECAIRETQEEIGITPINLQFYALTNDIFFNEDKHYVTILLRADYPEGAEITNKEPHKTTEWKWFSLDKLPTNLFLPLVNLFDKKPIKH